MSSKRSSGDQPGERPDSDSSSLPARTEVMAAGDCPPPSPGPAQAASLLGQHIGRYHVIDILGRGGMGTVYEAVQENPRRRVALKVINPGLASEDLLIRFEHEAHILGKLNHPGIADIYESGTFDQGAGPQPYFAMELVKGETLINYARHHGLSVRQRLTLVARICRAVLHAHQKGIIHRDLKPANIVVVDERGARSDGDCPGQPKVLDFGVARATNADVQAATVHTEAGMLIGTFSYMSPEQAVGDPDELDTRSDVYSLGVIAYELLGGRLPYNLNKTGILEAVRLICHDTPAPLSSVDKKLGGDIEIIVHKALAKSKEQRYQSALEFADDITRYLRSEPIMARPPSATYRMARFAKRNKALVAGVIAVFLVLVGGVATATTLYLHAEVARAEAAAQRDRAERHSLELEQVAAFQAEQLSDIDAARMAIGLRTGVLDNARRIARREGLSEPAVDDRLAILEAMIAGADFTGLALTLLDEYIFESALEAMDRQFADQPLLRARLRQTVATTMLDLGRINQALEPQRQALDTRRELLLPDHPDTLESTHQMGRLLRSRGDYDEAHGYLQQALSGRLVALGGNHPDTLQSINEMGRLLEARGELAEAESRYREALAGQRKVLGNADSRTLATISDLGLLLEKRGLHTDAEMYLREALEGYRRELGDDHRFTLNALNNMGGLFWGKREIERAEPYWRAALDGRRQALGNDHPDTLASTNNYGSLLRAKGELNEAEAYFSQVVERAQTVLGDDHPTTLTAVNNMASILVRQGRLEESELYFQGALAAQRRQLGDAHPNTLVLMHNLAHVLRELKRFDEAEEVGNALLAGSASALPEDHPHQGIFARGHVQTLIGLERFADAETQALASYRAIRQAHGADHETALALAGTLAELYEAWNAAEPDDRHRRIAEEWRARLPGD